MAETRVHTPRFRGIVDRVAQTQIVENQYTEAALARHKREGLDLAIRARWVAMGFIAVFLVFLYPRVEVLFYHGILALLCLNGWFMRRVGVVGQSRKELFLIFLDLLIMTVGIVMPNPLAQEPFPVATQYRFDNFQYFYIILAAATLAYSWRTVIWVGIWTAGIWLSAAVIAWWLSSPYPGLTEGVAAALAEYPRLARLMDPNGFNFDLRLQEVVVFVIVAVTLGVSVRRFSVLLRNNAGLERERANLSRYFSPNVVEELSQKDEPLKAIRSHDIAVLFIDIVNFTSYSESRDPLEVIEVLRGFHGRMEAEVFRHGGTLDKYLGDGLMATFGTPTAGDRDATDALECARAMIATLNVWNAERRVQGEDEICAGIGIHYGPAVLGDIGANRLEFAVVGTTVNVSSRLEALTRQLGVKLVVSDDLRTQVVRETGGTAAVLDGLERLSDQNVRGISEPITIWTLT